MGSARPTASGTAFVKDHNVVVRARGKNGRDPPEHRRQGGPRLRPPLVVARFEDPGRLPDRARRREGGLPDPVVAAGRRPGPLQNAPLRLCPATSSRPTSSTSSTSPAASRPSPRSTGSTSARRAFAGTRTGTISPIEKIDRGHQRFRLIRGRLAHRRRPATSSTRRARRSSGRPTARTCGLRTVNWLDESDEIIYASERDGWRHLYLIDAKTGTVKNPITQGRYVVRGIDRIDEDAAPGLVSRQRQEPRSGSLLHPLLPRQLRRRRAWSP